MADPIQPVPLAPPAPVEPRPAASDFSGQVQDPSQPPKWKAIADNPSTRDLSNEDYDLLRKAYFRRYVVPQIGAQEIEPMWQEFDKDSSRPLGDRAIAKGRALVGNLKSLTGSDRPEAEGLAGPTDAAEPIVRPMAGPASEGLPPIRDEKLAEMRGVFEKASPEERDRLMALQNSEGRVYRFIAESGRALAPPAPPKPATLPWTENYPTLQSVPQEPVDDRGETVKGVQTGVTGAKQMLTAAQVIPSIERLKVLEDIDRTFKDIEGGKAAPKPRDMSEAALPLYTRAELYANGDVETRRKLRANLREELAADKETKETLLAAWQQYQSEMKQHQGRVVNATDIGSLRDFGDWFAFSYGQALPYMGLIMLAGATGSLAAGPAAGAAAAGTASFGLAVGDIESGLIEQGREGETARAMLGGVPYAAMEFVGVPVRILKAFRFIPSDTMQKAAETYYKRAGKEVPAGAVREMINEGGQEIIKDYATKIGTGEAIVTEEALLRWANSAAAGGPAGTVGGAVAAIPGGEKAAKEPPPPKVDPTVPEGDVDVTGERVDPTDADQTSAGVDDIVVEPAIQREAVYDDDPDVQAFENEGGLIAEPRQIGEREVLPDTQDPKMEPEAGTTPEVEDAGPAAQPGIAPATPPDAISEAEKAMGEILAPTEGKPAARQADTAYQRMSVGAGARPMGANEFELLAKGREFEELADREDGATLLQAKDGTRAVRFPDGSVILERGKVKKHSPLFQMQEEGDPAAVFSRARSSDRGAVRLLNDALRRQFSTPETKTDPFPPGAIVHAPAPKKLRPVVDAIQKVFGVRVVFFEPTGTAKVEFDGVFEKSIPGILFLNRDNEKPLDSVAAHELLHRLRHSNQALYEELKSAVLKAASPEFLKRFKGKRVQEYRAMLRDRGVADAMLEGANPNELSPGMRRALEDYVLEEMVADAFGDSAIRTDFWGQIARTQPSTFARLARIVRHFIRKLLGRVQGTALGSDEYVQNLRELDKEIARLMGEYVAESKPKPAPAAEAASFSRKQTDPTELKRWFGKSQVVDEDGAPLVVYHGTGASFDVFDATKGLEGMYGAGFYFSAREEAAREWALRNIEPPKRKAGEYTDPYAVLEEMKKGVRVKPAYLKIVSPADGRQALKAVREAKKELDEVDTTPEVATRAREILESRGYDGVMTDGIDGDIVAFRPDQIRSAGPDARFSRKRKEVGAPRRDEDGKRSPLETAVPDKDAAARLGRRINRDKDVGAPSTARETLTKGGKKYVAGKIANRDWWDRVQRNLSPEELVDARKWYQQLHDALTPIYGTESAPRYALAWLLSQQQESPSGGWRNVLRASDIVQGKARVKQAGLNEKNLVAALRGEDIAGGVGAKLLDFVDSELGLNARTVMGRDVRGRQPAAIDIWAFRDVGFVDDTIINYVRDNFGSSASARLSKDLQTTETQYEYGIDFYNNLVDYLNEREIDGGGWSAREVQAVGWVTMQRQVGVRAEFVRDIIGKNVRRVSIGLVPGTGTRLSSFLNGAEIPVQKVRRVVRDLARMSNVVVMETNLGVGAYLTEVEGSIQIDGMGSPEGIRDFMAMLGYVLQQTEVISTRPLKSGKNMAIDIFSDRFSSLDDSRKFFDRFMALQPKDARGNLLAPGFQQATIEGRPALRLLNLEGKWGQRQVDGILQAVESASQAAGIEITETQDKPVELWSEKNDWIKDQEGGQYLASLTERGRDREAIELQRRYPPSNFVLGDEGSGAAGQDGNAKFSRQGKVDRPEVDVAGIDVRVKPGRKLNELVLDRTRVYEVRQLDFDGVFVMGAESADWLATAVQDVLGLAPWMDEAVKDVKGWGMTSPVPDPETGAPRGQLASFYPGPRTRVVTLREDVVRNARHFPGSETDIVARGYIAHELSHALDSMKSGLVYGGGIEELYLSVRSPLFDVSDGLPSANAVFDHTRLRGKIVQQAWDAYTKGPGELRRLLSYPMTSIEYAQAWHLQVETFAQIGRLFVTNPELLKEHIPDGHALFEQIAAGGGSRDAVLQALQLGGASGAADGQRALFSRTRGDAGQSGEGQQAAAGTVQRPAGSVDGDRGGRDPGGELAPLPGAPDVKGAAGPDVRIVRVAERYARENGIPLKRQEQYVEVDEARARRIAAAYEAMPHAPQDPAVREAYENLAKQTMAQYRALAQAGYRFWFFDESNDPYAGNPWNAMRDLRANKTMGVFATEAGFGSGTGSAVEMFDPEIINASADVRHKSREKLIEMPIEQFLSLAEDGRGADKEQGASTILAQGKKFNSLPFLNVESDGRVTGHEGRHRARALQAAGHTTMPVLLRSANIRWSEQSDPARFDYIKDWPARLTAQKGAADEGYSVTFPVTREQAAQDYQRPSAPDVSDNPLLADTGIMWPYGGVSGKKKRVLMNDLFRAVHDAFGHGMEGAGFRARGEENAWQSHVRLFTGSAVGALTSETRGQNSWLNYGPHGEKNRNAKVEGTTFADQKAGLMPKWTWTEGARFSRKEQAVGLPDAPPIGGTDIEESLDGYLSPRDEALRERYTYDNKGMVAWMNAAAADDGYQDALQQNLKRLGFPEVFAAYRGHPIDRPSPATYANVTTDRRYAEGFRKAYVNPLAADRWVVDTLRVHREDVVAIGHTDENELIVRLRDDALVVANSEIDSAKFSRKDSPEFKRRFGKSVVVDEKGEPLMVYRGEHGAGDVGESRLGSLSFGSLEAAETYAMHPNNHNDVPVARRTIPAYLRIEKPVMNDPDDPFIDMPVIEQILGRDEALKIAMRFADHIEHTNNWERIVEEHGVSSVEDFLDGNPAGLAELYLDAYPIFDDADVVAKLKAAGFDGAIHGGNGETALQPEYKVFDRDQVISAISPDAKFSRKADVAPVFYSALKRAVETSGPAVAPIAQWRGIIKNMKGVSQAEVVATELNEWLDSLEGAKALVDKLTPDQREEITVKDHPAVTGKLAKQQIVEFLKNNGVVVTSKVVSASDEFGEREYDEFGNPENDRTADRVREFAEQGLVTPGGTNERVILLQLPKELVPKPWRGGGGAFIANKKNSFYHSHWPGERNVVAHIRGNDRTDSQSRRAFHVDELQGDWGQKGRKLGFEKDTKGWTAKLLTASDAGFTKWMVSDASGNRVTEIVGGSMESAIRKAAEGVPLAPFVTSTDAWLTLALKRLLRYAAEEGYDLITFANGAQQTSRYWGHPVIEGAIGRWHEATKPESLRELSENVLGGKMASMMSLDAMDGGVLSVLKYDQVVRAVVSRIPVDVVDVLAANGIDPEQLLRDGDMVFDNLPVHARSGTAASVGTAIRETAAAIRTKLGRLEPGGNDFEVLPAMRASDLGPRELAGLLDPVRLFHGGPSDRAKEEAAAGPPAEAPSRGDGRKGANEQRAAELTSLLNAHAEIVHGRNGLLQQGFEAPPSEGMIAFYDKVLPTALNKLLAKLGVGKATQATIGTGADNWAVVDATDEGGAQVLADGFTTRQKAEAELAEYDGGVEVRNLKEGGEQLAVEITPQLRETVLAGLPMFRRKAQLNDRDTLATAAMKILAEDDDLFQQPTVESKDMVEIAKQISPRINVGNSAKADHNRALRNAWYFEIDVTGQPGKPYRYGYVTEAKDGTIWLDVSDLRGGKDRGSEIYNIVATYAHNNGLEFIGDPVGISEAGKARRLQNMISSALRFGTTKHIRPHTDQMLGWQVGNDEFNLQSMFEASWKHLTKAIGPLQDVVYNFTSKQFEGISDGKPVTDADFDALAATRGARAAYAGRNTLKRAVLIGTLLRATGSEARRQILGDAVRQRGESLDRPLIGALYSRKTKAPAPKKAGVFFSDIQARKDQTKTDAVKKWFGKSKVVDKAGAPLVVWHAAPGDVGFTVFDMQKAKDGAHFFTGNKAHASRFGAPRDYFVKIENPKIITQDDLEARWDEQVNDDGESGVLPRDMVKSFVEEAKAEGRDGLIVRGMGDLDFTEDVFLPFTPGQIKSASENRGTFDGANPDVRFSRNTAAANVAPSMLQRYRDWAARTVDRVNVLFDPLGHLPNKRAFNIERMLTLGKISKANDIAKELGDIFNAGSQADREAAYHFLVTADAKPDSISNKAARDSAVRVKALINKVGDELVDRGLLSEEARETHRDAYLPRIYLRYMLSESDWKAFGAGKKPGDMGYLKKRQDIPEEIRRLILGEITDPGFLSGMAIARPLRDMALLDWLQTISQNENWVLPGSTVKWKGPGAKEPRIVSSYWMKEEAARLRKMADFLKPSDAAQTRAIAAEMDRVADKALEGMPPDRSDYKRIPDAPRYGRLRGVWVRKEIYDDIMGVDDLGAADKNWVLSLLGYGGIGTRATQIWKSMKVAMNPPGQVRNFVSNMVLLNLSGIPMHSIPILLKRAISDVLAKGKYYKLAKKYGLTEATFAAQELYRMKVELLNLEKRAGRLNPLGEIQRIAGVVMNAAGDAYQFTEAMGKIMKMMHEIEANKLADEDAAHLANEWLFDYSRVPQWLRALRSLPIGSPFFTFQYKVLPKLIETALLRPERYLPYAILFASWPMMLAALNDVDDDDIEALEKALPQWLKERGHALLLPWKDDNGRWQVADLGYFMPWGFYGELGASLARGDITGVAMSSGAFTGPLSSVIVAVSTGKDAFTNRNIVHDGDPPFDQMMAYLNYTWSLAAPPFLTQTGALGHGIRAVTGETNKYGDPRSTYGQAALRLFGVNIYALHPEQTRNAQLQQMSYEIRRTQAALGLALQDKSMTPEQREKVVAKYRKEAQRRVDKLKDYVEESKVHPNLKTGH